MNIEQKVFNRQRFIYLYCGIHYCTLCNLHCVPICKYKWTVNNKSAKNVLCKHLKQFLPSMFSDEKQIQSKVRFKFIPIKLIFVNCSRIVHQFERFNLQTMTQVELRVCFPFKIHDTLFSKTEGTPCCCTHIQLSKFY